MVETSGAAIEPQAVAAERAMQYSPTAVAIIGMAGRFPDAPDVHAFWRNLTNGVESLTPMTDEELRAEGVPAELIANPNYVKKATFLEGADQFDAAFFGFNAREAEILDPQQRVFLECAWNAMEDAGYVGEQYPGVVSVFAGASINTYIVSNILANPAAVEAVGPYQVMISNDKDFLATRVNYKLNLRGPGLTVQTACSTSLVAVQLAWQSLLDRQCDIALAGGVSINFPQKVGYLYQEGMIFSSDGRCRPFDARGEGIRGGSGAGAVVLKRLDDAIADGDSIHAVILGAAINNDGADKMGYTAPSIDGQAKVISMAQKRAGVDPRTISYIEAHGTATPLGDPIEVAALTQAFQTGTTDTGFCALGSVKSNIGHLDAAAGVAGLIKTALSLEHKQLPPSLNFHDPNPQIDFDNSPFYVNHTLTDWKSNGQPRRAGVSSFGIGGTNAHAILEEAPMRQSSIVHRPKQLLVLSARSASALDAATENLAAYLENNPNINLADVAYTLQVGRKRFEYRRAVVCETVEDAVGSLRRILERGERATASPSSSPSIAFLFSGQGSQYAKMGHTLYDVEPTFRDVIDKCAEQLRLYLGINIRELMFAPSGDADSILNQTQFAQPALFVIEYALARTLMAYGIRPATMLGHSIGEYVAACLAGVLSLEDSLRIVSQRGKLMQSVPAGRMIAVPLPEGEVVTLLDSQLDGQLSLAAVNGPRLCVVAGPSDAIAKFERQVEAQGVECRALHTSHAFHSAMMDPILPAFRDVVSEVKFGEPAIPYISNLTGTWVRANEVARPEYWSQHLRSTVRFSAGVRELMQTPDVVFLEVGPGKTLSMLARQTVGMSGNEVLNVLPHPLDEQTDMDIMLHAVGRLWVAGAQLSWSQFHRGERLQRVSLPPYPFERQRYLVEPQRTISISTTLEKKHDVADWLYVPSWKRVPSAVDRIGGRLPLSDGSAAWLIFVDDCDAGSRALKQATAAGYQCLTVYQGDAYSADGDRYTIRLNNREDYDRIIADVMLRGISLRYVLHCWTVTAERNDNLDAALDYGFFSVIHTMQALSEVVTSGQIAFTVISNGVQRVLGDEPLAPAKSLLLGPVLVISHEMSSVRCRSVDIVLSEVSDRLIEKLLIDVIDDSSLEPSRPAVPPPSAYRNGHRWVEAFEPLPVDAPSGMPARLRERGVYLITGGLGGLGLLVARFLAETVKARLILVGRSDVPDRTEWTSWLTSHAEDDSTSARIRSLQDLESLGAEVFVAQADVSDRAAMERAVADARTRFGTVHGVFHVAGVPGGAMLALHDREVSRKVLAAKVDGALVLDSIFTESGLDFLVLFSSINSFVGIPGATDYSSANRFLDSYATARSTEQFPVIAINWDAWQEVGMAATAADTWNRGDHGVLRHGVLPKEGIDVLRRVLSMSIPQIAVVTRDLPELLRRNRLSLVAGMRGSSPASNQAASTSLSQHARPELTQQFVESRNEREQFIVNIWRDLLGLDRIGIEDNFFELGGHSLIATGMLTRIQQEFGVKLSLRTIFDAPTVRELADRISAVSWVTESAALSTAPYDQSDEESREEFEV